ncbi:MAG: hypothetical protein Q9186_005160 [Xanthomendoza sp. 1 TL-2023]
MELALSTINHEVDFFKVLPCCSWTDGHAPSAAMNRPQLHLTDLLRGLKWRAQIQRDVWKTFLHLCRSGHCRKSSLAYQMHYFGNSDQMNFVLAALRCFPIFDDLTKSGRELGQVEDQAADWQSFSLPLYWLAIMLIRGSRTLGSTIAQISASKLLGKVDMDRVNGLKETEVVDPWKRRPDECRANLMTLRRFGVMLPSGVDFTDPDVTLDSIDREFNERFDRISFAYNTCFGNPCEHQKQHSEPRHQSDELVQ